MRAWLAVAVVLTVLLAVTVAVWAQMDTLQRMEQDFLTLNEPCNAEASIEERIEGIRYLAKIYRCGSRVWRLWSYRCPEGYWSRPFLLDQDDENQDAYALNQFGELHSGLPAFLIEAYRPHCGT